MLDEIGRPSKNERAEWLKGLLDVAKERGITPDGGGKDQFVHYSAILNDGFKTLDNGARVAYEVRDGRNGQEAFDVRVVPFN